MTADDRAVGRFFDLEFWTGMGARASRIASLPVSDVLDGIDEGAARVLIVDRHQVVAQGIEMMLSAVEWIDVIGVATSGQEALELIRSENVDLVILDVNLGSDMDGVQVTERVKAMSPETRVLFLSVYTDPGTVADAIAAGADGYLSKEAERGAVVQAVEEIFEGKAVLDPNVAAGVFERIGRRDPQGLTERELEILQQLSYGKTAREIAAQIHISEETVKTNLKHIYRKLGVRDRTEAVADALRRGLIH